MMIFVSAFDRSSTSMTWLRESEENFAWFFAARIRVAGKEEVLTVDLNSMASKEHQCDAARSNRPLKRAQRYAHV
jgi:hypothetical protein